MVLNNKCGEDAAIYVTNIEVSYICGIFLGIILWSGSRSSMIMAICPVYSFLK